MRKNNFLPIFTPGDIYMTPGAREALADANQPPEEFLYRHLTGDWGDLDAEDVETNQQALLFGGRLMSAYLTHKQEKLWLITESDRSCTTLLLPSEY